MVVDGPLAVTSIGGADGPGRAEYHTIVVDSLPPASSVSTTVTAMTEEAGGRLSTCSSGVTERHLRRMSK